MTGGFVPMARQNAIISAGVLPAASRAALIPPADVPESTVWTGGEASILEEPLDHADLKGPARAAAREDEPEGRHATRRPRHRHAGSF